MSLHSRLHIEGEDSSSGGKAESDLFIYFSKNITTRIAISSQSSKVICVYVANTCSFNKEKQY